jgi:hypothetical protein
MYLRHACLGPVLFLVCLTSGNAGHRSAINSLLIRGSEFQQSAYKHSQAAASVNPYHPGHATYLAPPAEEDQPSAKLPDVSKWKALNAVEVVKSSHLSYTWTTIPSAPTWLPSEHGGSQVHPDSPEWPNTLAICTLMRNERPEDIVEWLTYHRYKVLQGFPQALRAS